MATGNCGWVALISVRQKVLAEITAKLELEISVLREQKLGIQATTDVLDAALKRQEASTAVMQEEYVDRLKQQELAFAAQLETQELCLAQLTDDLKEARSRFALAEDRNRTLEDEIQGLRGELHQARLPSPDTEAELQRLRIRTSTLEASEMASIVRAKTLDARYRVGDLVSRSRHHAWACGLSGTRTKKRRRSSTHSLRPRKPSMSKNWSPTVTNCAV